jgi:hypothetical protein
MDIQILPGTIASVREMCECGRRAFEHDGLENALFPTRRQTQAINDIIFEFRLELLKKRMSSPGWYYVLATTKSTEGQVTILGYAGWIAPQEEDKSGYEQAKRPGGNQVKQEASAPEAENYPESMDVDAYKHAMEVIEKTKQEILAGQKVWCKLYFSLLTEETQVTFAFSLI